MRKANRKPPSIVPDEDIDPTIAQYETMPIEQVKAELDKAGIDPRETIATVKALVREALRRRHARRSVHLETLVALVLAWLTWLQGPIARPS